MTNYGNAIELFKVSQLSGQFSQLFTATRLQILFAATIERKQHVCAQCVAMMLLLYRCGRSRLLRRASSVFRINSTPVSFVAEHVFVEQHFKLASGYVVGALAGGMEVEQIVPFARTPHFAVVRTTDQVVQIVFGQTSSHLSQTTQIREGTTVFIECYPIPFRPYRLIGSAT